MQQQQQTLDLITPSSLYVRFGQRLPSPGYILTTKLLIKLHYTLGKLLTKEKTRKLRAKTEIK
jgi:hypothetical protein